MLPQVPDGQPIERLAASAAALINELLEERDHYVGAPHEAPAADAAPVFRAGTTASAAAVRPDAISATRAACPPRSVGICAHPRQNERTRTRTELCATRPDANPAATVPAPADVSAEPAPASPKPDSPQAVSPIRVVDFPACPAWPYTRRVRVRQRRRRQESPEQSASFGPGTRWPTDGFNLNTAAPT